MSALGYATHAGHGNAGGGESGLASKPASGQVAPDGGRVVAARLWLGYLAAIAAAELLLTLGALQAGLGLHLVLLFVLPAHASATPARQRPFVLSLVFAPLIRVVSLTLPLADVPVLYWYALTSVPLFIAVLPAARVLSLSRAQLGLRPGNLPRQLSIGLLGLPLGVAEYAVLRPQPIVGELSWQALALPSLILLVCTGFMEELIFRGVLQATVGAAIGRWGLVYVSAVFAALHIGYRSPVDVVIVFLIGFGLAHLVARTGSLLGVTLAHGVTNCVLLLVLPLVAAQLETGGW